MTKKTSELSLRSNRTVLLKIDRAAEYFNATKKTVSRSKKIDFNRVHLESSMKAKMGALANLLLLTRFSQFLMKFSNLFFFKMITNRRNIVRAATEPIKTDWVYSVNVLASKNTNTKLQMKYDVINNEPIITLRLNDSRFGLIPTVA